jgi:hypothetical protein
MNSDIRRITVQKHDTHLFKSIRRKVSDRQNRGYMIQTFQNFTEGYLYYKGRTLIGITIWENVEGWPNKAANNPGKQPDYMNLCIYYNPTNMECVLSDVEEQCRVNNLEYITYNLFESNEYPLFLNHNYYLLYGYTDAYVIVIKYMNANTQLQKKMHVINDMIDDYNNSQSSIYRHLLETFHADILETAKIPSD